MCQPNGSCVGASFEGSGGLVGTSASKRPTPKRPANVPHQAVARPIWWRTASSLIRHPQDAVQWLCTFSFDCFPPTASDRTGRCWKCTFCENKQPTSPASPYTHVPFPALLVYPLNSVGWLAEIASGVPCDGTQVRSWLIAIRPWSLTVSDFTRFHKQFRRLLFWYLLVHFVESRRA